LIFNRITVFGAGTMGTGIAQVCANAGARVTVCDVSPEAVKRAQKTLDAEARDKIEFCSALMDTAEADLVIEAVTERMEIKQDLFARLDGQLPPTTILATNTGTLSVTAIAAKTRFPERVCGLHFFNPPQQSKLVEIVDARQTAAEVLDRCVAFVRELEREPILAQDAPGFVVTRCSRPFFNEALHCLEAGLADVPTIDEILRVGGGFAAGPFEEMDQAGLDAVHAITRAMWEGSFHAPRFRPHLTLRKLVEAGYLGVKTGRGFYEHRDVQ
jgi:3-hydroxybutyryl-CoA dehydrogenase